VSYSLASSHSIGVLFYLPEAVISQNPASHCDFIGSFTQTLRLTRFSPIVALVGYLFGFPFNIPCSDSEAIPAESSYRVTG